MIDPRCFIIAEAGVNHGGSEDKALRLVDAAVLTGADAVKFQTFRAEKLVTEKARKAAYQVKQTGDGNQLSMLQQLELSESSHRRIAEYCKASGIEFISTPFDEESADLLVELGCRRLKIASGELTNLPFLRYLATKGVPLILSTGMAELKEVGEAVETIAAARARCGFKEPLEEILTLLHCTSAYPAPFEDVNLRAMQTLAAEFGLPVGYSDHTAGTFVAPLARALGAVVFEKHLTLDSGGVGPDHAASLDPDEFAMMVKSIRATDQVLGSSAKRPTASEADVRIAARRSITLAQAVAAGHVLQEDDLVLRRPATGIPPRYLAEVIGRRMAVSCPAGEPLRWEHLSR